MPAEYEHTYTLLDRISDWYNAVTAQATVTVTSVEDSNPVHIDHGPQNQMEFVSGKDLVPDTTYHAQFDLWQKEVDEKTPLDVFIRDDDTAVLETPLEYRHNNEGERVGTIHVSYQGNTVSTDTGIYRAEDEELGTYLAIDLSAYENDLLTTGQSRG